MGMLMHHTWLNEQKKKVKAVPAEKPVEETNEPSEPVKKTGGRRKTAK